MAAKKKTPSKKPTKPPTAAKLAAMFGITVQTPLTADQIWRLRKPLPGYVAMLDDAAGLLEAEGDDLQIKGITPADLLAAQEEQRYLAQREAILHGVYRAVYEQRLQADDRAMKMLEKIARRVNALAEDDPTLKARWKVVLDFLATFRSSGATKAEADTPAEAPAEAPAAPAKSAAKPAAGPTT